MRRSFTAPAAARILVVAGSIASLLSCDKGILAEPAASPTGVSISYDLSPAALVVAGGSAAAFDATTALRVELSQGESAVLDTLMSLAPVGEEMRVSLEVPLASEEAAFQLDLTLLRGEDPLFRGREAITLKRGASTPIDVSLDPVPSSIELSRTVTTLGLGDTLFMAGTPLFATGHGIPDVALTWFVEDAELLEIDRQTGRIVGKAEGSTRVHGSFAGLEDTVTVTVRSEVDAVAVTFATAQIGLGETTQGSAQVRDKRGNVLVRTVEWSTSDAKIATVDASGLITAVGEGTVAITATSEGRSSSENLLVRSAVQSVSVTLAATQVALKETTQGSAEVRDARGNVLQRTVLWSTSDPKIATVNTATGLVTAVAEGTVTITATAEDKSAGVDLLVRSAVGTVAVSLSAVRVGLGETAQASADVRDVGGIALVRTVQWTTSDATIATVNSAGLITPVDEGTVSITATVEGKSGSASLVVRSDVESVTVTLAATELGLKQTTQATAQARDARGNLLLRTVTWSTSDPEIATVSPAGLVTAEGEGTVSITATVEGVSGSASLAVQAVVATVTVTLAASEIGLSETTQATAVVRDADGNVLIRAVEWSTSNGEVASVSTAGLVTGVGEDTVTITATAEGKSGSASLRVRSAVASVTVTLPDSTLEVGDTVQATAVARDARNNILQRTVRWTSSNTEVATVSASGVVAAWSGGDAVITATAEDVSGSAPLTVVERTGRVQGVVRSAIDRSPIVGATVRLLQGADTVATMTSDASGQFDTGPVAAGTYSLTGSASGYIDGESSDVQVASGQVMQRDVVLSPEQEEGGTRIVLTWGSSPRDLDSHLAGPDGLYVYYGARGSETGFPYARLDLDDTDGNGPETITISRQLDGAYCYGVHNYSGEHPLSASGATVDLYRGNEHIKSFRAPSDSGTLWTVFRLDGTAIVELNQMSTGNQVSCPSLSGAQLSSPGEEVHRDLAPLRSKPVR